MRAWENAIDEMLTDPEDDETEDDPIQPTRTEKAMQTIQEQTNVAATKLSSWSSKFLGSVTPKISSLKQMVSNTMSNPKKPTSSPPSSTMDANTSIPSSTMEANSIPSSSKNEETITAESSSHETKPTEESAIFGSLDD